MLKIILAKFAIAQLIIFTVNTVHYKSTLKISGRVGTTIIQVL